MVFFSNFGNLGNPVNKTNIANKLVIIKSGAGQMSLPGFLTGIVNTGGYVYVCIYMCGVTILQQPQP